MVIEILSNFGFKILDTILLGSLSKTKERQLSRRKSIDKVEKFSKKVIYAELEPFMSRNLKKRISNYASTDITGQRSKERENIRKELFKVIVKVERKWKII